MAFKAFLIVVSVVVSLSFGSKFAHGVYVSLILVNSFSIIDTSFKHFLEVLLLSKNSANTRLSDVKILLESKLLILIWSALGNFFKTFLTSELANPDRFLSLQVAFSRSLFTAFLLLYISFPLCCWEHTSR